MSRRFILGRVFCSHCGRELKINSLGLNGIDLNVCSCKEKSHLMQDYRDKKEKILTLESINDEISKWPEFIRQAFLQKGYLGINARDFWFYGLMVEVYRQEPDEKEIERWQQARCSAVKRRFPCLSDLPPLYVFKLLTLLSGLLYQRP